MLTDFSTYAAVLLDLDGTVYHEDIPLPGSKRFIEFLTEKSINFACLSNSTTSPRLIGERLKSMDIHVPQNQIFSAAAASAEYVLHHAAAGIKPRVMNLATEGVQELLDGKVEWVNSIDQPCDAIIIGAPANAMATEPRQRTALVLLRQGAKAVAICNDRLYPSPRGWEFGSGALTAMLAHAANITPIFVGKPEKLFFEELCHRLKVPAEKCILIGDNLEADIAGARNVGMKTILTLTGVARKEDLEKLDPAHPPDAVVQDLSELLAVAKSRN